MVGMQLIVNLTNHQDVQRMAARILPQQIYPAINLSPILTAAYSRELNIFRLASEKKALTAS